RLRAPVRVEPVSRLLDDSKRRVVAVPRGLRPRDESVAAEDQADGARLRRELAHLETQIEPGTLPGHPPDRVAEDRPGQPLAIARRSNRDDRVGVHVIDVPTGNEA